MKRIAALLLSLLLAVSIIPALAQSATAPSEPVTVTVVVAGGLGDRSFYDSANEGLQMLIKEFGVDGRVMECKEDASLFTAQLASAAEISDYVVAVGWQFYDGIQEVAAAMPNVKFVYVDQELEGISNILSIPYTANEGSFLVGYVAGKLTKTNRVGAVGGMDDPVINDFLVGYIQGAKYANSGAAVETIYAGSYEDPSKGKECALTLFGRGCDIVFAVAGKTGEGVFEAAKEQGKYAIGVDADQKYINPDVIIASMKKNVGLSIYTAIKDDMVNKVWNGGTAWLADMKSGFIDIGYGTPEMTQQVSDELKAEVENIKQLIISGKIVVDTTR
jgi:basic membrane protein A and related proteins